MKSPGYIVVTVYPGDFFDEKRKAFINVQSAFGIVALCLLLSGCSILGKKEEKVRDLTITPVSDSELPQELQTLIKQKTSAPFKMTYTTDENLYIAVGYGPQEGGGYSICVNELYLTGNSVVIATELKGPENGEDKGVESSSPYIVVKTELLDLPVVFQ